jgi:hypothetical protein
MSRLVFTKQAAPATPATNKSAIYVDTTTRRLSQIDDNGVISILTADGMMDRNILTNGGLMIQQRVAVASTAIPSVSTTTRAGRVADRWAVTTGNVTTTSWAQTDAAAAPETGLLARYYGRITQATNAAKFIFSQWIINSDMSHLRGQKVRCSVKLKQIVGSNQTYKLGLLQLTSAGTVDTSPAFISAIGASGVNPTWGTNLSAITPDASPTGENGTINGSFLEITSTAAWVRSSCVFTIPTDCKNLVWVLIKDATGGATDSVGIAECQMTQGPEIIDFVQPPIAEELIRCQRFFNKSFPLTVVPAASLSEATAGSGACGMIGKAGAVALAANYEIRWPVVMWAVPTVTFFTPTAAGAQCWRFSGAAAAAQTATAARASSTTDRGTVVTATGDAAGTVGDLVGVHYTADAEIVA